MLIDVITDTIIDALKILPFLWITFFILEVVEHKFQTKTTNIMKTSGKYGPLLGGIVGLFPQCGFSVMATNLYITRIITLGTLISVYLTTSDEMLPILLANGIKINEIIKILGVKFLFGVLYGIIIDLIFHNTTNTAKKEKTMDDICQKDHCHCENGLILSSLKHTLKILLFIIAVSFFLNIIMAIGGEDILRKYLHHNTVLSPLLTSLIGLIPNCGASVILTELYLNRLITFASAIAGLLTGSGVALIVLLRSNNNKKENIRIILLVYFLGAISGILLEIIEYLF